MTGATSTIGALLPMLLERGGGGSALDRKPVASAPSDSWHALDLAAHGRPLPAVRAPTLIHTASLWLLPDWLERFLACGVRRVIAFNSTSRFTKQASASAYELEGIDKLIAAEEHGCGV